MGSEELFALSGFAFVTSFTPGPNNLMLMASGVNFGLRRSFAHMMGINFGFVFMLVLTGLGLASLVHGVPELRLVLKILSIAYMLWLAWKIAHAAQPQDGAFSARPLGFLQAAAFQWVNPKAWSMVIGANALYAEQGRLRDIAVIALVFALINLPCIAAWAWAGQRIRHWLVAPRVRPIFNQAMALALIACLWPMLSF
jgi:threonine/homoserine/homoserine lactone efflux protein